MANQVLFVQGGGAGTHDTWDSKLVESLRRELGPDYHIRYPRMPSEANPKYSAWKESIDKEVARLGDGAILVGHSVGATILINFLADHPPEPALGGVFLIGAPFIGDKGWPSDDIEPCSDLGARLPAKMPIYLYHGGKDRTVPVAHVELYAKAIPQAVARRLAGRDHQLNGDMSEVAADIRGVQ